ncbi:MAG: ATP synthase F1 subunit delta [Gemmatimonadota bacterium]|nr:ATP synthase F1 subunit delta [Gemmatimonadota bacterium]
MRGETVARKYAETLFELGVRAGRAEKYGEHLREVSDLLDTQPKFRLFLETPRIDDEDRKRLMRDVLGSSLPKDVMSFLLVTIDKRRQRLLREIATQYQLLVDEHLGRQHVEVTVARPLGDDARGMIAERLSRVLGKEAIPHVRVKPDIIGGLVVRTGDTIYDGSVRRRLEGMRSRMLRAELPAGVAGGQ